MDRGAEGEGPSREEIEEFLKVREHVQCMLRGTPLLFGAVGGGAQEELRVCTCWVTEDLQSLKWREREGDGPTQEIPISAIADVVEESADDAMEDSQSALSLVLRSGTAEGQSPPAVSFVCASPEDCSTWRDGLKFLAGVLPPPGRPQKSLAGRAGTAGEVATTPPPMATAPDWKEQWKQQYEANEKLQKENSMLREVVKRKDTTIAQLLQDLQSRATAAERCNKTESTSRESDEHLRDREAMILRRNNRRLQKTLRAKQQTISELLRLVGHVTSQQGAESSAVEDNDDDEDAAESDRSPDWGVAPAPVAPQPHAFSPEPRRPGKVPAPAAPKHRAENTDVNTSTAAATSTEAAREAAAAQKPPEQDSQRVPEAPGRAGAAPVNGSKAALQALAQEMALLEEKKRVVERLARQLEPASDVEEEEDGFPLR